LCYWQEIALAAAFAAGANGISSRAPDETEQSVARAKQQTKAKPAAPAPSRLQADLAARILRRLKEQGAGPGHHLVELDLCQQFGVSRTPIRGALKLLAAQGVVEARANRGFVLIQPVTEAPDADLVDLQAEEDQRLFVDIAKARTIGRLAADTTQQEIVRMFGAKLPTVLRVLRQLADLGLVERKPGNGWSFLASIDSARAQDESYAYRRIIEPQLVLQPTFELDRTWAKDIRARHLQYRNKPWRNSMAVDFYQMNADFHEGLARCSGNRYLLSAVQRQNRLRSFLNYQWEYGVERVHASVDEHLQILDALERGDNEGAAALMQQHLSKSSSLPQHSALRGRDGGAAAAAE
jgi:DNA-binding GntR family transcriptional regulator